MMGTREDCKRGEHTSDNQGLCWWCGVVVHQDWLDAYYGQTAEKPHEESRSAKPKRIVRKVKNTVGTGNKSRRSAAPR